MYSNFFKFIKLFFYKYLLGITVTTIFIVYFLYGIDSVNAEQLYPFKNNNNHELTIEEKIKIAIGCVVAITILLLFLPPEPPALK